MPAMIGKNRLFEGTWSLNNQRMLLAGALLVFKNLTFKLDTRLKRKADEIELLLWVLYGYNLICFLKPATPLRLPGRLKWGLVVLLKITPSYINQRKKPRWGQKFHASEKIKQRKIYIVTWSGLESFFYVFLSVCFPVNVSQFTFFLSSDFTED